MADHPSNRPSIENLDTLFSYHAPSGGQPGMYDTIRASAKGLAFTILANCPSCADTSAAVRHVREAVMLANAAIALAPPLAAAAQPEAAEPPAAGGSEPVSSLGIDPQ